MLQHLFDRVTIDFLDGSIAGFLCVVRRRVHRRHHTARLGVVMKALHGMVIARCEQSHRMGNRLDYPAPASHAVSCSASRIIGRR